MDINVAGLNKVYCFVSDSSLNGRTVKITDSVNTWTKTISSLSCVFMIPSMPAPAKKTYTVMLMNSAGTVAEYSRQIELGFGDSVKIGLFTNDENANKGYVLSEITSHAYSLPTAASGTKGGVKVTSGTSNGVYMDGEQLKTYLASSSQIGCMKTGTGLTALNGTVSLDTADSSNLGGIMIGNGLQMSSGKASVKPSTGLNVSSSGVYLKPATTDTIGGILPGYGLQVSSSGTLSVKPGTGLYISSDGVYLGSVNRNTYDQTVNWTISPNTTSEFTMNVTNSDFYKRIQHGCVYGLESGNNAASITLEEVKYVSSPANTIAVKVAVCNPKNETDLSIGTVKIRYWYFGN